MTINLKIPDIRELKPRITVFGVGGAGGNAVNNMITAGLQGVDFVVANTDAQALTMSKAERIIQMGVAGHRGSRRRLAARGRPRGRRGGDRRDPRSSRRRAHGVRHRRHGRRHRHRRRAGHRARRARSSASSPSASSPSRSTSRACAACVRRAGIAELQKYVDTLIIIPNQNLFRVANEKTTFADAFAMADQVLYSGVACITDLMVKEGLINLDFADVRAVMREMGKAMMGTGEASGEKRALRAAEAAISNPLIDDVSMKGARGLLISITGGKDLTLYEVDEAATRIREEVDQDANIIVGATFDESLEGIIRVSVVATGIDHDRDDARPPAETPRRRTDAEAARRHPADRRAHRAGAARDAAPARISSQSARRRSAPWSSRRRPPRLPPRSSPLATRTYDPADRAEAVAVPGAGDGRARRCRRRRAPSSRRRPERPQAAAPRMPRIDELPIPAQNEMRPQRGERRRSIRRSAG